jgi:hypothetical protein
MKLDTFLSCSRGSLAQTLWILAAALSAAAGIILLVWLKPGLPLRILLVTVPVACGIAYTFRLVRDLGRLDELQLRIQLEAAATACLGVFLAAMVYPVFERAGFVGQLQPYYVLFLLLGLLLVGCFNANRRYR